MYNRRNLAFFPLILLCVWACQTDPDYDVAKIDTSATVAKNITFPVGDIKEIKLGDIFKSDVNPNDYLKTGDDGIYYLSFSGRSQWTLFNIDSYRFGFHHFWSEGPVDVDVAPDVSIAAGTTTAVANSALAGPWPVNYTYTVAVPLSSSFSDMVQQIVSADFDAYFYCYISNWDVDGVSVRILKGTQLSYPEWLVVESASCDGNSLTVNDKNKTMTFLKDATVPESDRLCVVMKVRGLSNIPVVEIMDGESRSLEGDFSVSGSISLALRDRFVSGGRTIGDINVTVVHVDVAMASNDDFTPLARATVSLNEDKVNEYFDGSGVNQSWTVPSFLDKQDAGIVFNGLRLNLSFDNDLSTGLTLESSFFREPEYYGTPWRPSCSIEIPRGKSVTTLTDKEIPGLDAVLSPVFPERLGMNIGRIGLNPTTVVLEPDKDYSLGLEAVFDAPLSFSTILHSLSLHQNGISSAEIKFTAVNTFPVNLHLSAAPVDYDGSVLQGISLTMNPSTIPAGSVGSPSRTPMTITLESGGNGIEFSGLQLSVDLSADKSHSPLDKNQGLAFEDVKFHLPDGIGLNL